MGDILDTVSARYHWLEPHIEVFGPKDDLPRPAIILFHGCGGLRPHIHMYAQTAALAGVRAFVVDSFAPRGWGRLFATSMVCSGAVFQGDERAGDVLAALWGVAHRSDVIIDKVMLAGWSHGGWSIMDLMTHKLTRKGEVGLADPDPEILKSVAGLFLVYSYLNFPARSLSRNWYYKPETLAVIADKDHLSAVRAAQKTYQRLKDDGVPIETLTLKATHAFEEESFGNSIMKYDKAATEASLEAMMAFIDRVFELADIEA